jgi:murein biosynthesis integral membrane protein MurJ
MSEDARSLGRSTAVMAAGTATSRVLGLLRVVVLVGAIGSITIPATSFAAAYWLPTAIYMLIAGGVLNAVLVPQIVRAQKQEGGGAYVDRLLTVSILVLGGVTALLIIAAPLVVTAVGANRSPEYLALTTAFAVWSFPQVFFYGLYTLLGQILNARGVFGPYMWAPVVNNVVAIAGLLAFIGVYGRYEQGAPVESYAFWTTGPMALLAGTATLGVVAQALVLLVPLRRIGFRFRPRRGWRGVGLGSAAQVAGWTFAALVVGQVGVWIVTRIGLEAAQVAEEQGLGAVATNNQYTIAFTIFMLPHSLVTVSLVTALYTRLANHAADDDVAGVRRDLAGGLRTVGVFTVLATAVVLVLALPVSRLIVINDVPEAAAVLAPVVVTLVLGLVALGGWSLVQRVYYAYEDARSLFWVQVPMAGVVVGVTLVSRLTLDARWWVPAAGAAIAASYWLGAVRGGLAVRRRLGGIGGGVGRTYLRASLAAVVAAGAGWPVSLLFGDLTRAGLLRTLVVCGVVGLLMLAVYVVLLRVLGVRDLEDLVRPLLRRAGAARTMTTDDDGVRTGAVQDAAASSSTAGRVEEGGPAGPAAPGSADRHGGGLLDSASIGRGALVAGRYRLEHPERSDLPGVELWAGRDQILDRPVRVSLLLDGRVAQAQDAARRAALVSDPRLLRVLDVGDHEGVAYVVAEPPRGRDLLTLTSHGPLPADQARAVVGEAAVALEVARRRGVHHLALRPTCLHVTDEGAVLVSGLGMDGELAGIGLGDARSTTRADTVALVGLLYLALTGRWPAPPGTPAGDAALAPVVAGAPVPPADLLPGVPNDLDTLCTVTLGPHDDGPHSPAELVRELEPWGDVDPARVAGVADDATAWQRHLGTASASACAAGAVVASGASAVPHTPAPPAGTDDEGDGAHEVDGAGGMNRADGVQGTDAANGADGADGTVGAGDAIDQPAVARHPVRTTFDQQALAAPARPGTPPPAIPPSHRLPRPDVRPAGGPPVPAAAPRSGVTTPVVAAGVGAGGATAGGATAFAPVGAAPSATAPTGSAGSAGAAGPATAAPPGVPGPARTAPSVDGRPGGPARAERHGDVPVRTGAPPRTATRLAFDPTPWVLGIILLAVVVGLWTAWRTITSPLPPIGGGEVIDLVEEPADEEPAAGDGGEAEAADGAEDEAADEEAAPAAPAAPVIASAQQLDPPPTGDDNEHPEAVPFGFDGDPSTFWYTRWYASPEYGMKPGVGYAVTLAEPAVVASVTLQMSVQGGLVEVRATDPSTPTEGEVLASGEMGPETVLTFPEPVEATHIVLWFPRLPQDSDGRNRVILNEVVLNGPAG